MLLTKPPKSYNYKRISNWSWDLAGSVERHTRKHKYKKLVSHNSDDKLINTSYTLTSWRTLNISKNYLWSLSSWVSHKSVVSLSNSRAKREKLSKRREWTERLPRFLYWLLHTGFRVREPGGITNRTPRRGTDLDSTTWQVSNQNPQILPLNLKYRCWVGPSIILTANDMSLIYYSD